MTGFLTELRAAARLDLADVRRSRWALFAGVVYALLAAVFVLVGMKQSSVLGFTGFGRVFLSFSHALVLLLPLLALAATAQTVNRARDDGSLELLLTQPIRREAWFIAVSLVRLLALLVPLVVLVAGAAVAGAMLFGQPVPWAFLARSLLVCTTLLAAFVAVGLAISTFVRNGAKATMLALLVWAAGVALLDFGLIGAMLSWRLDARAVFVLASLNPVQSARLALLSGLDPDLATLGPVGFYLANRVGQAALFALGLAWPAAVALGAWGAAFRRFRHGDLV